MTTKKRMNLSCEVLGEKSRYFDFSDGYLDEWELAIEPDEEDENDTYPMMNYIYPLGKYFDVPGDWKEKLVTMTIVLIDDEYFLALTGGGMDLSWQICETYINLGYYPPTHFCSLPHMAGWKENKKDRVIIDCCAEALEIPSSWNRQVQRQNDLWFGEAKKS